MRTAWHCITPKVIVKGFEKCCVPNAMDATDGYMLWNDVEVGSVRNVVYPMQWMQLMVVCCGMT